MKKGQTGVIVILLIVVVIAVIVLLPQIQNLIPTGNGVVTPEYKNDIITVERIHVSPSNPYAGSVVRIGFNVKSNAEFVIPQAEVNFFDLKGLDIVGISCDDGVSEIYNITIDDVETPIGAKCTFTDFDTLDFKLVELILRTPNKTLISSETPMTISYYINYSYFGYRSATIPVIDGTTKVEPLGKFDQSTATYGPVVLDFELPHISEREEDDRIIREYWVVGDQMPFELKMNFRHIGSNLGIIEPVNITEGNVALNTTSLSIAKVGNEQLPCDFKRVGTERNYGIFSSEKSFLVPKELICNFQADLGGDPEISASVYASFSYTYKYTRTETFTVRPIPEE